MTQQMMGQGMGTMPIPLPVVIVGSGGMGGGGLLGGGVAGVGMAALLGPLGGGGGGGGGGDGGGGNQPGVSAVGGGPVTPDQLQRALAARNAGTAGTAEAGKGMGGGMPEMDKFTKSITSLGTQMGAFTEAFQGGMIWRIEGTHDINVNLNGAEVFGTLTEMFETYVMGKTGAALVGFVKELFPNMPIPSLTQVLSGGLLGGK